MLAASHALRRMAAARAPLRSYARHQLAAMSTAHEPFYLRAVPSRAENLARLEKEEFDILVIGGGSTGAGAALDAATRGLKVAMVEQEDFASGTSSRSTKLIWAGSRYLVEACVRLFGPALLKAPKETIRSFLADFKMVMGAHRERKFLLETQPHLTRWLPIAVPLDKWLLWPPPFAYPPAAIGPLGMFPAFFKFYDFLSGFKAPGSYVMSAKRAYEAFPQLDKRLKYCQVFYEGQHDDARTNIAIALTAAKKGAAVANYAQVQSLVHEYGKVRGAVVRDVSGHGESSGKEITVKAKQVLFCGGPFTDGLRKMEDEDAKPAVTGAAGIHVVLPAYYSPSKMGMVDMATSDGRFLFFLPWEGHTIVGTTDSVAEPTMTPVAAEDEIQWVINEASKYLSDDLHVRRQDVLSAWSGIRPLAADPHAKDTSKVSRDHVVSYNEQSGIVFLAGGKWTTYREMAEDGVDKCIEVAGLTTHAPCSTLTTKLLGHVGYSSTLPVKLIQKYNVTESVAEHLSRTYGGRAHDVLANAKPTGLRYPAVGIPLVPGYPYIEAEVSYAIREYACTASDVLARRTRLAFLNSNAARDAAPRVVELLGDALGWDAEYRKEELARTMTFLATFGGPEPNKEGAALRAATRQDLRDVFDSIDTDGSGCLSMQELGQVAEKLGFKLSEEEVAQAMREMDVNKDGSVSFEEFSEWWNSASNNKLWQEMTGRLAATSDKISGSTGTMFG